MDSQFRNKGLFAVDKGNTTRLSCGETTRMIDNYHADNHEEKINSKTRESAASMNLSDIETRCIDPTSSRAAGSYKGEHLRQSEYNVNSVLFSASHDCSYTSNENAKWSLNVEKSCFWVSAHHSQGGRKYMEDQSVVQIIKNDHREILLMAVYDGHGGSEAAIFAKSHVTIELLKQWNKNGFCIDDEVKVMRSIRESFLATHLAMRSHVDSWKRTSSGYTSTAGTTATVAIIISDRVYIGHVGDSGAMFGLKHHVSKRLVPHMITKEHKPDCPIERNRINNSGGIVMNKSGVERVVWNRPLPDHSGPIRRSTDFVQIPFLAVARSLGDLWSYNSEHERYVVSPDPDVCCYKLNYSRHQVLILASDGLWHIMPPECVLGNIDSKLHSFDCNPAASLVNDAIYRWERNFMRPDNTTVVCAVIDPENFHKRHPILNLIDMSGSDIESETGENNEAFVLEERINLNESGSAGRTWKPAPETPTVTGMQNMRVRLDDDSIMWHDKRHKKSKSPKCRKYDDYEAEYTINPSDKIIYPSLHILKPLSQNEGSCNSKSNLKASTSVELDGQRKHHHSEESLKSPRCDVMLQRVMNLSLNTPQAKKDNNEYTFNHSTTRSRRSLQPVSKCLSPNLSHKLDKNVLMLSVNADGTSLKRKRSVTPTNLLKRAKTPKTAPPMIYCTRSRARRPIRKTSSVYKRLNMN